MRLIKCVQRGGVLRRTTCFNTQKRLRTKGLNTPKHLRTKGLNTPKMPANKMFKYPKRLRTKGLNTQKRMRTTGPDNIAHPVDFRLWRLPGWISRFWRPSRIACFPEKILLIRRISGSGGSRARFPGSDAPSRDGYAW